jgi:hypothetical protein
MPLLKNLRLRIRNALRALVQDTLINLEDYPVGFTRRASSVVEVGLSSKRSGDSLSDAELITRQELQLGEDYVKVQELGFIGFFCGALTPHSVDSKIVAFFKDNVMIIQEYERR